MRRLPSNRGKAISSFPRSSLSELNSNVHMFSQDLRWGVVPIGGRMDGHPNFSVRIDGDADNVKTATRLLAEIGQRDRNNLTRCVCEAINQIATQLSWSGRAPYELVSDDAGVHLANFTSRRLIKVPGYYLQFVPKDDWNVVGRRIVAIPSSTIWCIDMPPELGGRNGFIQTCKQLAAFDLSGPDFWRVEIQVGNRSGYYDFETYRKLSEVFIGQTTRNWGWGGRNLSHDRETDFYTLHRMIKFARTKALIREHIVKNINELYKRLAMDCTLNISGLPSSSDISLTSIEFSEGRLSFGEIYKRVRV